MCLGRWLPTHSPPGQPGAQRDTAWLRTGWALVPSVTAQRRRSPQGHEPGSAAQDGWGSWPQGLVNFRTKPEIFGERTEQLPFTVLSTAVTPDVHVCECVLSGRDPEN